MTQQVQKPFLTCGILGIIILIASGLGLLVGIYGLIASLMGQYVFFNFGPVHIEGVTAGMAGIFIMPLVFTLGGALLALLIYLPLKLLLWAGRNLA